MMKLNGNLARAMSSYSWRANCPEGIKISDNLKHRS